MTIKEVSYLVFILILMQLFELAIDMIDKPNYNYIRNSQEIAGSLY